MMSRATGRAINEDAHIRQSVSDILTTPIGSRVMRREYGSLLPELIDQPGHAATRLRLMAATVMALLRWEPRLRVTAVGLTISADGKAQVDIDATRRTGPRTGSQISIGVAL